MMASAEETEGGGLLIGIDAGSSVLKGGLFDRRGSLFALARQPTPRLQPQPGIVEADPAAALRAFDSVLADLVSACTDPQQIRAIGITGAMVGAWLVDKQGNALRPGINWEDSRSQTLLEEMLAARPSLYSDIFAVSGSMLQQGCTLPLLASLRRTEPDVVARATHVLTYKDFLRHHLTGEFFGDRSEAAVMPGDARRQGHSEAMRTLFDLAGESRLFPPILASTDVAGRVCAKAAQRTGLAVGTPVVAGAGDVIANVVGSGGYQTGAATAILGTTCMVGVVSDHPVFTPPDLGLLFSLPDRRWYRAMVNVAGTSNLDWALPILAPELATADDRFGNLTARVAEVPPGARGVTFLPYLSASGIIAPVADASARAQFCGLHGSHTADDMLRAVLEGVAFAIDDLLELLALPSGAPVTLAGGGARNPLWVQMIADITGRTITLCRDQELGAKGAAMLAECGVTADLTLSDVVCQMTGATRSITPDPRTADLWPGAKAQFAVHRARLLG